MIYIIQDASNKRIKIGKSDNPIRRIRRFRTGSSNPDGFDILAILPGGARREKELHERFIKFHSHGEWFEPSDEIIEFIHENTTGNFKFCRICGALHLAQPNIQDIRDHSKRHVDMRKGMFPYNTRELMKSMARASLSGHVAQLKKLEKDEAKRIIVLAWWARAKQSGLSDSAFDDYMLDYLELLDAEYDGKGDLKKISEKLSKVWNGY